MAKQPSLPTITGTYLSATQIDDAFRSIETAFDNTLSRDGSTPNTMSANLDMDSNDILNVGTIYVTGIDIDGVDIAALTTSAAEAAASASAADASAIAAAASASDAADSLVAVQAVEDSLPTWRGPWLTATAYALGDLVSEAGSSYICIVAHTAGVFATDLAALKWEVFAQKGAAGAGTGDMLAANNLSDVANAATSRGNLGLGSIATQASSSVTITGGSITGITDLAVADGGTGASTAPNARTNLGLGTLAVQNEIDITDFAAATLVTAADTVASNDNDTTVPTTAAIIDYVATQVAGFTRLETQEPTSDVSAITFVTDVSSYGMILVEFIGSFISSSSELTLQIRTSGGTWRSIAQGQSTGAANDTYGALFLVTNVDNGAATNLRFGWALVQYNQADTFDRTAYTAMLNNDNPASGYSSHTETINEVRLLATGGNIEGTTANQRSIATLYGAQ